MKAQEGPLGDSIEDWRFHMQEGPKGPKRAQEGSLDDSIKDWRFQIQERTRGPKKRFYRGLEISNSKGPKRAQEGLRGLTG